MSVEGIRGLFIAALFIGLVLTLISCWWYGRHLIKTEKTDVVFGNPAKALGGWHWVVSGVATIILVWLYFSWDAARAFFPRAANELCQVAKVDTALNPMRSAFPFESPLLKGTRILDREYGQIERIAGELAVGAFTDQQRLDLEPFIEEARQLLAFMSNPDSLDQQTQETIVLLGQRILEQQEILRLGKLPQGADEAIISARETQLEWGSGNQEIPNDPTSERGALFASIADPLKEVSNDFSKLKNANEQFLAAIADVDTRLQAYAESANSEQVTAFARDMNKLLKRIDNGAVFPPGALAPIESALASFNEIHSEKQGGLALIDAIAMPAGTIVAGNTACSEQGSGRWLPKPSDTFATFMQLSDPEVGYKGVPLLWYKQKPVAEMVGFVVPDFVASLVPGEYPRHKADGTIEHNLKSRGTRRCNG